MMDLITHDRYRAILRPLGELTDKKIDQLPKDDKKLIAYYQLRNRFPIFAFAINPYIKERLPSYQYATTPYLDPDTKLTIYTRKEHEDQFIPPQAAVLVSSPFSELVDVFDLPEMSLNERLIKDESVRIMNDIRVTVDKIRPALEQMVTDSIHWETTYIAMAQIRFLDLAWNDFKKRGRVNWIEIAAGINAGGVYHKMEIIACQKVQTWWFGSGIS